MSKFIGVSRCTCEKDCAGAETLPSDEFCGDLQQLADDLMANGGEEMADALHENAQAMRQFETGATRNKEVDPDIYGFTSPLALGAFAEYMHKNRLQADGTLRDSDNWKKGIPLDSYIRSMRRHMQDLTLIHDGYDELAREGLLDALGGLFFNVQGYMHEAIKQGLEMGPTLEERILDVIAALGGDAIIIETGIDFEGEEEVTDA